MSNSIAPGSSADVNVKVTALTSNSNVPVTYKTIILKKNIVNGVNTLTQEMISATNTKYVIKHNFTLDEDITVPANCVLAFDGGSISGAYIITGNNTGIQAGLVKIFNIDILFGGSWNIEYLHVNWFGCKADGIFDNTDILNHIFSLRFSNIKFGSGEYYVSNTIFIEKTNSSNKLLCIRGESQNAIEHNGTIIKTDTPNTIFSSQKIVYGLTLSNINFKTDFKQQIGTNDVENSGIDLFSYGASECVLQNLKFTGEFKYCLKFNGSITKIDNCYFNEIMSDAQAWDDIEKNRYGIYLRGTQVNITNCNFWRVRTGIKLADATDINIFNNWFEKELHNDIDCIAPSSLVNLNIYNNTFLSIAIFNNSSVSQNTSPTCIKFDGNQSGEAFYLNTVNIYSNRFYNDESINAIELNFNRSSYPNVAFLNIHIFNNVVLGQIAYMIKFANGTTSPDVSMYGNYIKNEANFYNDQYDRAYKVTDVPKYGTTIERNSYKYWSRGDIYFDKDLNKNVVFVGHIGTNTWVNLDGSPLS